MIMGGGAVLAVLLAFVERPEWWRADPEQLLPQRVDLAVAVGQLAGEPVEHAVDVGHAVAAERDRQPEPVEVDRLDHPVLGQPGGRPIGLGVAELATATGRDDGDGTEDRGHEEHQNDYHDGIVPRQPMMWSRTPGVARADAASGGRG